MASYELLKEIAQEAIDHLDNLNQKYPNLSSGSSVEAVEKWRQKELQFDASKNELQTHTSTLEVAKPEEDSHDGSLEIIAPSDSERVNANEAEITNSENIEASQKEGQLKESAVKLLKEYDFEDVLDKMASEHDCNLEGQQLVELVGKSAYHEALKQEVAVFASNAIAPDQAANLWNSLGRPSLYGGTWTETDVIKLTN
jgi:hypothetical protein